MKYDNGDVYPESRNNNTVTNTGASSSQQHIELPVTMQWTVRLNDGYRITYMNHPVII